MIDIKLKTEFYSYDAFHIVKAFFPNETIERAVKPELNMAMTIQVDSRKYAIELPEEENRKKNKHMVNIALYQYLRDIVGHGLDWGILTGIRPTKIAMKEMETGKSAEEVCLWLQDYYQVSKEKAELAIDIALREQKLLSQLDYKDGYSLYIGIPFCPTRCSYCSFTAFPIKVYKQKVDAYIDALCKELTFVGRRSKEKKLNTIYMGGGTPTTLTAKQLDRVLSHVEETFSYEDLQEITVEAGRPDSITREKLEVLKNHGIERISINPQTMQQKTLDAIGRKHTVEQIREVYQQARDLGFSNINMDLIMGLPGENLYDVKATLEEIQAMNPDSLTIHSLAMKRASKMTQTGEKIKEDNQMAEMIALGATYAKEMDLEPYYLYRQKNMAGNFENVGYAKVDKAGIYNILIMEEKQSIIAVGAGASTKIVLPREKDNIVRIENVKDVDLYIANIEEMNERKGEWLWH